MSEQVNKLNFVKEPSNEPREHPTKELRRKPLPQFHSVLKPGPGKPAASPASRPPRKLEDPTVALQNLSIGSGNNAPSPFASKGKFMGAAAQADKGRLDHLLEKHDPSSHTRNMIHSRPRFKQVLGRKAEQTNQEAAAHSMRHLVDDLTEASIPPAEESDKPFKVEGLVPMLLPHQVRGVQFMINRENGRKYARGGILADDMGLGKTCQSIALILHQKPPADAEYRTTLVVAPLAVLDQWKDEISAMAPSLKVETYQGPSRKLVAEKFRKYDVIVTTYNVISADPEDSPLFTETWYRIIADEAHSFRNPKTKAARAMFKIQTVEQSRRWALTGTPVHNTVNDMYTLLSYVGFTKYAGLEFSDDYDPQVLKRELSVLMLRRTQRVLKAMLPPIHQRQEAVEMSAKELEAYYRQSLESKPNLLVKLIALRLGCDGLIDFNKKHNIHSDPQKEFDELSSTSVSRNRDVNSNQPEKTQDIADILGKLSLGSESGSDSKDEKFPFCDNSKVLAVRKCLLQNKQRKTVIFTTFLSMMEVLKPMLDHEGIAFITYHGAVKARERQKILADFRDPKKGLTVLLCTLQTAAVGLNLTAASRVIMVDTWWNPQIIDQAIKRVHRLGQSEDVECVTLYAKGILEERMLELLERKRELAKNLIAEANELTAEERSFLITEPPTDLDQGGPFTQQDQDDKDNKPSTKPPEPTFESGKSSDNATHKPIKSPLWQPNSYDPASGEPSRDQPSEKGSTTKELPKKGKHIKFTD